MPQQLMERIRGVFSPAAREVRNPECTAFVVINQCTHLAGMLTHNPSYGMGWAAVTKHLLETQFDPTQLQSEHLVRYVTLRNHLEQRFKVFRPDHSVAGYSVLDYYPVSLFLLSANDMSVEQSAYQLGSAENPYTIARDCGGSILPESSRTRDPERDSQLLDLNACRHIDKTTLTLQELNIGIQAFGQSRICELQMAHESVGTAFKEWSKVFDNVTVELEEKLNPKQKGHVALTLLHLLDNMYRQKAVMAPAASAASATSVAALRPEHLSQLPVLAGIYYLFVCSSSLPLSALWWPC